MKSKVMAHWVIRLTSDSKLFVKVGDVVNEGDKLLTISKKSTKSFFDPQIAKLPISVRDELNHFFDGKFLNKGDLIYKTGTLFPVKILSLDSGFFLKIDEFGSIHLESEEKKSEDIESPIKAVVAKIEDDKLVLEFEAIEFNGESLVDGKTWGESNFEIINGLNNINANSSGKVILTEEINQSFLVKAKVLGVVAVVTIKNDSNFDKINTSLPILVLDEAEWYKLREYQGEDRQVLVNTKAGRLLIVVE